MAFNEDTRVKIPAILHLCRLGYEYISLKDNRFDESTNILVDVFKDSVSRINSNTVDFDIDKVVDKINLALDNEDLGQEFYKILTSTSDFKLIDFKDFDKNTFHVCTELTYKNGEDEFRPDITVFINGMPLVFIEVKKPNNKDGILAERDRIKVRFSNSKFRKFINLSQLLIFSNNMEYDNESIDPIQGAFYTTSSYGDTNFNCFREEDKFDLSTILSPENEVTEDFVLKDNNLTSLKHSPEFITNKNPNTPTNRILTSLLFKNRVRTILKYSIAYVKSTNGIEKHIMRYPQFFATKSIEAKLENGIKKGIIWHTQGSGKTALAYYNVSSLTDYYREKGIVPRFYFIVDRIDLLQQAKREFSSRGLIVHTVSSKEELLGDFRVGKAITNLSGSQEITVVNIQKFKDEGDVLKEKDYDINVQRIYFLDEVHRSYDPKGSFLANLISSDRNAVVIGLTGTPLIGKDRNSKEIFGDYIHKYYYNASIADGYTLRLIREGIETNYRIKLEEALKEIEVLQGQVDRRLIFSHKKFVEPMLDYIVNDFIKSRIRLGDELIGGMVVCDSSEQARVMSELFAIKYSPRLKAYFESTGNYTLNSDSSAFITGDNIDSSLSGALILHDSGTKDDRKQATEDFKDGKIDLLFVYNMLLTGFDAKRLKKLYIGRVIHDHNLLQTLTRVNRPYRRFRYGYVVDFADIRKEFDKTNKAYFEELQNELGDEFDKYSNLFKSQEEIESEIEDIKDKLFRYDLQNSEIFSQQITQIEDRSKVLEIKKALENARNLYNIIRLQGNYELLEKLDFRKLTELLNETSRHLDLLNLKENIKSDVENANLLNIALEDVIFAFRKVSENELVIADQLKDILRKTREALNINIDKKDPEFISLYDELKRLFNKKNLDEITQDEMKENIVSLQQIYDKITELNRRNSLLQAKYQNDAKYARIHKRIVEKGSITQRESELHHILSGIKEQADDKVLKNTNLLNNEGYFEQMMTQTVISNFENARINLDSDSAVYINQCVSNEYINEFRGNQIW